MSFISDRHKAFADVLNTGSTVELKKYCMKYGVPMPQKRNVAIAGVLKAIQYCTDFSEEEKTRAMVKCLDMGFTPMIKPVDYDIEVEK